MNDAFDRYVENIPDFDEEACTLAQERQASLTKPPRSLGVLEDLSVILAGICGLDEDHRLAKSFTDATLVIAGGSHGIASEGVSAYPPEVTGQMMLNFKQGSSAATIIAKHHGVNVDIIDCGVIGLEEGTPGITFVGNRRGTDSFLEGQAMDEDEALSMLMAGIEYARGLDNRNGRFLCLGDMGIGNTTSAAALVAALLDIDPIEVTGRGANVDELRLEHKINVISAALDNHDLENSDSVEILAAVGGFELAFLAGCCIGAAYNRMPVILDGYPTAAAALVACDLAPGVENYLLAGHCTMEPGHRYVLQHLELSPVLSLEMALGEGSGAVLSVPVIRAALHTYNEMLTFDEAGVDRGEHSSS